MQTFASKMQASASKMQTFASKMQTFASKMRHFPNIQNKIQIQMTFQPYPPDDALDVTSEPEEANLAIASSSSLTQSKMPVQSHNPQSKFAQLEVELGGSVTLQCPQGM